MSLGQSMQIARSALTASQLGIQVTSNNIANASTPGYTRQRLSIQPAAGQFLGGYSLGLGVNVTGIERQLDKAVQSRLWSGISNESAAYKQQEVFSSLEAILGELTDFDLSSQLNEYFNTWSDAANLIDSAAVVIERGESLAGYLRTTRGDVSGLRRRVEDEIGGTVARANDLLEQVAMLNREITSTEGGGGSANELRDQREIIISELSDLIGVSTLEDGQGNLSVLIGSTPVVLGGVNRGLSVQRAEDNSVTVRLATDNTPVQPDSGRVGALLEIRDGAIDDTIQALDDIAAQIIFQTNRLHSTGTNGQGQISASGTYGINAGNRLLAFNDPTNTAFSTLPFAAEDGGITIAVTNPQTGATTRTRIDVDLDGITNTGAAGYDDDSSPEAIRAALNDVPGVTASWSPDGRLLVYAEPGFNFTFESETSGVLAVLGVNAYFTGTSASDIAVRPELANNPSGLLLGSTVNGEFVANGTSLALVDLQSRQLPGLDGRTIQSAWSDAAQRVSSESGRARTAAEASSIVRLNLESQRAGISGVSIDEETINLLQYQNQFSGAARVIEVADQLLRELISIV